MPRVFNVGVFVCDKTGVLIATSTDISGLVVEAETIGGVMDAVNEVAPQLIETNLGLAADEAYAIRVRYAQSILPETPRSMNVEIPLVA